VKLFNHIFGIHLPTPAEVITNMSKKPNEMGIDIEELPKDAVASISFYLNQNGTVAIAGNWIQPNKELAEMYAKFLYCLHKGAMQEDNKAALKSTPDIAFGHMVLLLWDALLNEEEEEPVVKPLSTFVLPNGGKEQN
jgi:hypothetical protein